jgi:uncharacterized protein with LGFP repeats
MYWSELYGAFPTWGVLGAAYERLHSTAGLLGFPSGDPQAAGDSPQGTTGRYQTFEHGAIFESSEYGTNPVRHAINAYFGEMNGTWGRLGFPAGPEADAAPSPSGTRGAFQRFEGPHPYPDDVISRLHGVRCGATVYWSDAHWAHGTWGGIGELYERQYGTAGPLGFPTSDEQPAPGSPHGTDGVFQTFEGGNAYWTATFGAHVVRGGIEAVYLAHGASGSSLGFPVGDSYTNSASADGSSQEVQDFEGGRIEVAQASGLWNVHSGSTG